jgi:hypothetical protein
MQTLPVCQFWLTDASQFPLIDGNYVRTEDEKNHKEERDFWHISFTQMYRIVWILNIGRPTSHCPSSYRKVSFVRYLLVTACTHAWLYSDLLVQEHISAEQTTFSKCFYECTSLYIHISYSFFSLYPIGMYKVYYSILISFIIKSIPLPSFFLFFFFFERHKE